MTDFSPITPTYDGEEHVFAAFHHIVKALGASKNLTDDVRRLVADLDNLLSTSTRTPERREGETREVEEQLEFAQKKVMRWESNRSMIWALGREEAADYLQAVYEIQRLTESLTSLLSNGGGKRKELLDQANSVLHMAMVRLEEELIDILSKKKQSLKPEYVSSHSCDEDVSSDVSIVSTEDESIEETSRRNSGGTEREDHKVDLIHPSVISDIKSIANVMFASHYNHEFCDTFVSFWKDVLDEYFVALCIEKLSIEELSKMESKQLCSKIRKWNRAMKFIIKVYLPSEKRLFDQVFGEFGSTYKTCFIEASRGSMLCLLNFGEAVVIGPRETDKLFTLLDMYEVLSNLIPDIDTLFSEEAGAFLGAEFHQLMIRLGGTVKATLLKFEHDVASHPSRTPFPAGGIHHVTKYVMNYVKTLAEYSETLNLLLRVQSGEDTVLNGQNISSDNFCPLAVHLQFLTSNLESNIDHKSRLYGDASLKHIFMMNNIHYMVGKVSGSALEEFYGVEWIREYTRKFQQHETSYERATWSPILSLLRDDGNNRRESLRGRFRNFNIAFEEVYKCQTKWSIPDHELRKDLRISTSQKVIQAYRPFTGMKSAIIGEKYVKYSADELENRILDLFEGPPASLHNTRRMLTF
ncbi:exocyst complex component EXO70E2-like [Rhododendron vialii]|uniref:exocyst complex component EXO70E2-like n=1 Tax=Rhododendron vialii TaxID=182163 RepID=UPI00265ED22F|nr:exocyst complex component EXO70E2-like [Rhododendron vialii]